MRSNAYTLVFTMAVTIVLGFFLSLANSALKDRQELNTQIDMKKNILQSLDFSPSEEKPWTPEIVQAIFDDYISSMVVDKDGNIVEGKTADDIIEGNNEFPVFVKTLNGTVDGYAIPISGKGLWSTLFGYFAVESDGMTAKGITFYSHGETPGLGGEVEKSWFRDNFKGKRFINSSGALIGIQAIKGGVDESSVDAYHQVDGIFGATMTVKGLNNFLLKDLKNYELFFIQIRNNTGA